MQHESLILKKQIKYQFPEPHLHATLLKDFFCCSVCISSPKLHEKIPACHIMALSIIAELSSSKKLEISTS